ncbi:MAG: hypothetical protein IJS86_08005 [Lachnospiraceae bacterium]|nr:hypothetical protein [Lachnospiraceae bacterium]
MSFDYDMPAIAGIDWATAHRYLPSKEDLQRVLKEMVSGAARETDRLLSYRDAVMKDPSDENFDLFRIQAHALKASVRSIGSDLFDEAFALETAGKEKDGHKVAGDTEHFVNAYLKLADELKVITGEAEGKKSFDAAEFERDIDGIGKAMDAFDVTDLQRLNEKVQSTDVPDSFREWLGKLGEAVRDLESEKVAECCEKIKGLLKELS